MFYCMFIEFLLHFVIAFCVFYAAVLSPPLLCQQLKVGSAVSTGLRRQYQAVKTLPVIIFVTIVIIIIIISGTNTKQ